MSPSLRPTYNLCCTPRSFNLLPVRHPLTPLTAPSIAVTVIRQFEAKHSTGANLIRRKEYEPTASDNAKLRLGNQTLEVALKRLKIRWGARPT